MTDEEDIADFYQDDTGTDALAEFEALHRMHPRASGRLLGRMSHLAGHAARAGSDAHYHAEPWGLLYLVTADNPSAYMFFRIAPNAPTRLLVMMAGTGKVGSAAETHAMARFLRSKDL